MHCWVYHDYSSFYFVLLWAIYIWRVTLICIIDVSLNKRPTKIIMPFVNGIYCFLFILHNWKPKVLLIWFFISYNYMHWFSFRITKLLNSLIHILLVFESCIRFLCGSALMKLLFQYYISLCQTWISLYSVNNKEPKKNRLIKEGNKK